MSLNNSLAQSFSLRFSTCFRDSRSRNFLHCEGEGQGLAPGGRRQDWGAGGGRTLRDGEEERQGIEQALGTSERAGAGGALGPAGLWGRGMETTKCQAEEGGLYARTPRKA